MKRVENSLDKKQVLTVVEKIVRHWNLLDAYDHQNTNRITGNKATCVLTYEKCRSIIDSMKFGEDVYTTLEKKHAGERPKNHD